MNRGKITLLLYRANLHKTIHALFEMYCQKFIKMPKKIFRVSSLEKKMIYFILLHISPLSVTQSSKKKLKAQGFRKYSKGGEALKPVKGERFYV